MWSILFILFCYGLPFNTQKHLLRILFFFFCVFISKRNFSLVIWQKQFFIKHTQKIVHIWLKWFFHFPLLWMWTQREMLICEWASKGLKNCLSYIFYLIFNGYDKGRNTQIYIFYKRGSSLPLKLMDVHM